MTEQLRELVEITAGHHVPGSERVPQIVKTKAPDLRPFEQIMEALVRTLTSTGRPRVPGVKSDPLQ
jgi:hypothetical protein